MKSCARCRQEKEDHFFYKHKKRADGLQANCKKCCAEIYQIKKDYIAKQKQGRKDQIAAYSKAYFENNKERIRSNKSKYKKFKMKSSPAYALQVHIGNLMRSALKYKGFKKRKRTIEALGCTADEFKTHIERQFLKGMTWENRDQWHLDHVVPISSAKTEEEVYALSHFTNIRPLWASDNLKKSSKITTLI